ncbi:MAG TPA: 30S ribosomal protein S6 [Patescibacteria group bacterium]|nr:30S ribosomal protein S6 [Patescibacteria group bacterium]
MTYELMVLVAPSLDLTDEKAQKALVEKLIGDKASVKDVSSLGKKKLAYPINKQTEATYLVVTLEGNVKSGELDTKAKLMDDVLRLLLTVK